MDKKLKKVYDKTKENFEIQDTEMYSNHDFFIAFCKNLIKAEKKALKDSYDVEHEQKFLNVWADLSKQIITQNIHLSSNLENNLKEVSNESFFNLLYLSYKNENDKKIYKSLD